MLHDGTIPQFLSGAPVFTYHPRGANHSSGGLVMTGAVEFAPADAHAQVGNDGDGTQARHPAGVENRDRATAPYEVPPSVID